MSRPTIGGRPVTPPPGSPAPELLVARVRGHARRLFWSALILVGTCAAVGYFTNNVPFSWANNLMLWLAAAVVILVFVLIPFVVWLSRRYTITTRRVIAQYGIFARRRRELPHARGYTIAVRRGPIQRLWGSGTLTLSNGVDAPLQLVNVPHVRLLHEVLVDQVEVNQILAHRDAQSAAFG